MVSDSGISPVKLFKPVFHKKNYSVFHKKKKKKKN